MKKVTYGVNDLIDWTASIPLGCARMQVHFSGGSITKYGNVPAQFSTTNPVVQYVIEHSDYFNKKIFVVSRAELPGKNVNTSMVVSKNDRRNDNNDR